MNFTIPSTAPHIQRSLRWGAAGALLVGVIGATVLAGWMLQIETLKRLLPGMTSMNPLTAVNFELAALALWWLHDAGDTSARRLSRIPAALILVLGLSKLVDLWLGTSICPDDLLFSSQLTGGQAFPSRMAPTTATCFALLGLALLLASRARYAAWSHPQLPLLPVLVVALLAIVGYLYQDARLYGVKNFIPMAFHTAVNFMLASFSLMMLRPDTGAMRFITSDSAGGFSARILLAPCILIPVVLGRVLLGGAAQQGDAEVSANVALMVVIMVVMLVMLVMGNSIWLFRLDVQRRRSDRALEARIEQERRQAHAAEQLTMLDEIIRNARADLGAAPQQVLSHLVTTLGAAQGCFYQTTGAGTHGRKLSVLACYAASGTAQLEQVLDWGEGLAGQCARDARAMIVTEVPANYWRIRSGMLDALPRNLLLVPIELDQEVLGVIELATLDQFQQEQLQFMRKAARILAFALFRLRAEARVTDLLREKSMSRQESLKSGVRV